jgi:hypothetical protein
MTISLISSSIYLGILCLMLEEPFLGSDAGWLVLLIQAVVCQLLWLSLSYATQHARAIIFEFAKSS